MSLLDGLRDGSADAWSRLVDLWTPLLYGACLSRGFSRPDADDITQCVIIRVYKGLPGFQRDGVGKRFRFWIMKILRNEIADFCRRNAERLAGVGGSDHNIALQNASADEAVSDSDWFSPARVMARLLELVKGDFSERNWKAFELVQFEHLTNEEVGNQLGMTANAVRQATHRIRKRIEEEGKGMLD